MANHDDSNNGKPDWRRQAREIADSLAIAFILAMVIRHFVLEVFKIPTKSMQPTLLGDPWTGDKILVNKFAYDFRDPERWDVVVFKYPDNTAKNYIKRVVGLPGETIHVRDGDVYIDGQIARKPWPVQQALWRLRPQSTAAATWKPDDPTAWQLRDDEFTVDCGDAPEPQYLNYGRDVLAYEERDFLVSHHPFFRMPTSDAMVQFHLVPRQMAGSVHVAFDVRTAARVSEVVDQWTVRVPIGAEPQQPEVFHSGKLAARGQPYRLEKGRATLVQVCNVDMTLLVRIGGRELVRHDYEPSRRIFRWRGFGRETDIQIGCKQGHVAFREPSISVDVYYTQHPQKRAVLSPHTLDSDEFFVLGDNSCNSNDSRGWKERGGVPRRYLVGEAFLVLWPLGRMKIVR